MFKKLLANHPMRDFPMRDFPLIADHRRGNWIIALLVGIVVAAYMY